MRYSHIRRIDLHNKLCIPALMLVLLFSAPFAKGSNSESLFDEINLSGISGPFSFQRFCGVGNDELWAVGGDGSVQHTDRNGTTESKLTDKSLNGVYFTNSSEGWVVGDDGIILSTRDQGSSWHTQISGTKEDLRAITCTVNGRCWAVGARGLILRTLDKGAHWKVLKSGTTTLLLAVSFVNDQSGWAVGANGVVVHTTNAGQTWTKQKAVIVLFPNGRYAAPTDLQAVKFVDENRGWVAGSGGIARTSDGGKTWEVRQSGDTPFVGLVTNDGMVVWAVASDGTNFITSDGGSTWAPDNSMNVSAH